MKYRLVKKIYASGHVMWNIEKKVWWWWEYLDGYWDEQKARDTLEKLRRGTPYERKVVVSE
jgi:hypothetical protein